MTLIKLKLYLDNLLKDNTSENREKILLNIKDNILKNLIESILNNQSELEKVAKRSYKHSNGFDKIMLVDSRPDYALRLHLWNASNIIIDSHIHNHEWDLNGIVLFGNYRWQLFNIYDDSLINLYNQYKCIYINQYTKNKLVYDHTISVKKYLDITIYKNSFYSLDGNVYHKIIHSSKEKTASLVLHGKTLEREIQVISPNKLEVSKVIENNNYSSDEMKELLQKTLINLRG